MKIVWFGRSVVPVTGSAVSDTTTWIVDVTVVPRNDMAMEVHHGLTSGFSAIHPNVVAVGIQLRINQRFSFFNHRRKGLLLLVRQLEIVLLQFVGYDEKVSGRNRIAITDYEEILSSKEHSVLRYGLKN